MQAEELNLIMRDWHLNAAQLAKVLCLHTNKVSEYLEGVERIPCMLVFSIEAHQHLSDEQRTRLFEHRLNRKAHSNSSR